MSSASSSASPVENAGRQSISDAAAAASTTTTTTSAAATLAQQGSNTSDAVASGGGPTPMTANGHPRTAGKQSQQSNWTAVEIEEQVDLIRVLSER